MKAGDLINLLMSYDESDEVEIEIYETVSGQCIDTTVAISVVENDAFVPTLRSDIEAGKFKSFSLCQSFLPITAYFHFVLDEGYTLEGTKAVE